MKCIRSVLSIPLFASALFLAHCSAGDDGSNPTPPPQCVEKLDVDCSVLLYSPPTFTKIYHELIQKDCTLGTSCHSSDAAMGGLVLSNADDTYDALLGVKGGVKRVIPRDPACSPLMVRLESRDPNYVMPQGMRYSEPALCDFIQWIKDGAEKN
jgi:hypothetical protein